MIDQPHWSKRRVMRAARFCLRHLVELLGLAMAGAVVALTVVAWRLAQGPIPLDFARGDFEAALARAFDGDIVALGGVQIEWSGRERSIILALTEVSVAEAGGRVIAEAPRLEAGMRLSGLLRGEVQFSRLVAEGGVFTLLRRADGSIAAGIGRPDRALTRTLRGARGDAPDGALQAAFGRLTTAAERLVELRLVDAELFLRDEILGVNWRASSARISLLRDGEFFDVRASGLLALGERLAPLNLRLRAAPDLSEALFELSLEDASPAALFSGAGPLQRVAGLDAPVTLTASAAYREDSGIVAGDISIEIGAGELRVGDRVDEMRGAELRLAYDPERAGLLIETATFDVGASHGEISGRIDAAGALLAGAEAGELPFVIEARDLVVDARPIFERPLEATALSVAGVFRPGELSVRFDAIEGDVRASRASVHGGARLERVSDGRLLPSLQLHGAMEGEATFRDVLDFWPVDLADGARTFLMDGVSSGRIFNARFDIDLPAEALVLRRLPNHQMTLTFDFADVDVRIVSTMSPITGGRGRGVLYGNAFALDMDEGRLLGLELSDGRVRIPQLNPRGATATFSTVATGPARDIVSYIDEPPLEYPSSYGVTPQSIGGEGRIEVVIYRPMRVEVAPELITFTVDGRFAEVSGPEAVEGFALAGGDIRVRATEAGLRAWGEGMLGPLAARIDWREDFQADDPERSTTFHVVSAVEPAALDQLGVTIRSVLSGGVTIEARTLGRGLEIEEATVEADLADAELRVPGLTWSKPAGEPGRAAFTVRRDAGDTVIIEDAVVEAEGFRFAGGLAMRADGRLERLSISRLDLGGAFDLSAEATRGAADDLIIDIDAAYIDARGVLPELTRSGAFSPAGAEPIGGGLRLTAHVDRALVTDEATLNDVSIFLEHDGRRTRSFELTATGPSGPMSATVSTTAEGARTVRGRAPDAGEAMRALFGYGGVEGGTLAIEGSLPAIGAPLDAPSELLITARNFRLANAPALAQILSLGSLQGLADTLAGDGIAFSRLEAPVRVADGRFDFTEARAAGPALGFTASGVINLDARELDLEGVIVPVYAVNSFLGELPILGDLLVSRRGEGVFAFTYSISGPFEETMVFVNPLSALAPGLLRRIFESAPIAEAAPETREDGG